MSPIQAYIFLEIEFKVYTFPLNPEKYDFFFKQLIQIAVGH